MLTVLYAQSTNTSFGNLGFPVNLANVWLPYLAPKTRNGLSLEKGLTVPYD